MHAYLNNLNRLGLVWFSREPLEDPLAYQVLEAQPEVVEAMKKGRTRTVRRSIHLTPFGDDFCETVLPLADGRDRGAAGRRRGRRGRRAYRPGPVIRSAPFGRRTKICHE